MIDRILRHGYLCATYAGLTAYLIASPALLSQLSIPYDAPTGSFVFKIHPGSYLLLAACGLSLCARGNPLAAFGNLMLRDTALAGYLVATTLLLLYSAARYGPSGSAFIIDTLQMPAVVAILLSAFSDAELRCVYQWIIALLLLNTAIALGESMLQRRLVAYVIAGGIPVIEDAFRPTALLGHPLVNALITSSVLFTLFDTGRHIVRYALAACLLLGLLSFGGRSGFLLATIVMAGYVAYRAAVGLRQGRWRYLQILGALLGLCLCAAAVIAVIAVSGIGERIFEHLYIDDSATYRLRSFNVFNFMRFDDIVFGVSPADIERIAARIGLNKPQDTIENFWLFMLMQFGALGLCVFVAGLAGVSLWLCRRSRVGGRLALVVFLVVASGNNSLAAKTCSLTILFAVLESVRGFRSLRVRPMSAISATHSQSAIVAKTHMQ